MTKQALVETLVKPIIEELGYQLWGCEYLAQGQHSLLRIYIDKEDGIGIEDCEVVSRSINGILDVEDPIQGHYSLEVSSPGLPRPLFYLWQYEQYVGQELTLSLARPLDGRRKYTGIIASISNNTILLKLNDDEIALDFSNIVKAYLTLE